MVPGIRIRALALALSCPLAAGPAEARLTQAQLSGVAAAPPPDARVPGELRFEDAVSGRVLPLTEALGARPVLLLPVDYTCANTCDPMLALSGAALAATGLRLGSEAGLVLVGIDPRDRAEDARRMLAQAAPAEAATALVGDAASVAALLRALGYGIVYDAGTDGFAHPAAALLLAPDGRVARVLSPLALNGRDLRLALVEAGQGRVGTLADRLALLCYGYDAVKGVYTPLIRRILSVAAALTILAIALGVLVLALRERRA